MITTSTLASKLASLSTLFGDYFDTLLSSWIGTVLAVVIITGAIGLVVYGIFRVFRPRGVMR